MLFKVSRSQHTKNWKTGLGWHKGLVGFIADPAVTEQVDGLGRNAAMYCVHGNTPVHTDCLEKLINAKCDLDHQANGIVSWKSFHLMTKLHCNFLIDF